MRSDSSNADIFMVADLHLKENDPLGVGIGIQNTRTQKKFEILSNVVRLCVGSAADRVQLILLGDMFDSPRIPEDLRFRFFEILGDAIRAGVSVTYVGDNHTRRGSTNPFASESLLSTIQRSDKPGGCFRAVTMDNSLNCGDRYAGWNLVFVPFGDVAAVEERLKGTDDPLKRTIVFGHWPLQLFDHGGGHVAESGVDPSLLEPFHSVFLGDYHLRQGSTDNGMGFKGYIGSAAAATFGEVGYPHYICKLTLNEYPAYNIEWIDAGDAPMVQLTVEKDLLRGGTGEWICSDGDAKSIPQKALVKLIFNGTREDLASLDMKPWIDCVNRFNP